MWIPQWLAVVAGGGLLALVALLLFVAQYGGVQHAWDEYQANSVTFENTTDTVLCAGDGDGMDGCAREIKPRETSKWSTTGCINGETVTVYDPATKVELYRRSTPCGGFDGVRIVINQRDGQFVIADSLLAASGEPTATPAVAEASSAP